jgi:hypothetical protein
MGLRFLLLWMAAIAIMIAMRNTPAHAAAGPAQESAAQPATPAAAALRTGLLPTAGGLHDPAGHCAAHRFYPIEVN